jgi:hypothetical protein
MRKAPGGGGLRIQDGGLRISVGRMETSECCRVVECQSTDSCLHTA